MDEGSDPEDADDVPSSPTESLRTEGYYTIYGDILNRLAKERDDEGDYEKKRKRSTDDDPLEWSREAFYNARYNL